MPWREVGFTMRVPYVAKGTDAGLQLIASTVKELLVWMLAEQQLSMEEGRARRRADLSEASRGFETQTFWPRSAV